MVKLCPIGCLAEREWVKCVVMCRLNARHNAGRRARDCVGVGMRVGVATSRPAAARLIARLEIALEQVADGKLERLDVLVILDHLDIHLSIIYH